MPRPYEPGEYAIWVQNWFRKAFAKTGSTRKALLAQAGGTSQRISQFTKPTKRKDEASLKLIWRISSVFLDEDGFEKMEDERIRLVLAKLIATLGPRRLSILAELPEAEGRAIIDTYLLKAAGRHVLANTPPPKPSPKKK